ncbi:hypothetical protein L596_028947 [Steinernema carpocapsae]|uniref:RING-type domain-containing protein n=1 Tax=Steinernema carpocapsae TaxID=34508 RepID=A0A4U5LZZ2_STECR|nr:hypothetical protein L596_028947 [Steinernema carpocapsae]
MPLICSICQLGYDGSSDAIAGTLPCGHIFHIDCVQQWFHQCQNACPACRAKCSSKDLIRLFLDSQNTSESPEAQVVRLESELLESRKSLDECQASLKHENNKIISLEKNIERLMQINQTAIVMNADKEKERGTLEMELMITNLSMMAAKRNCEKSIRDMRRGADGFSLTASRGSTVAFDSETTGGTKGGRYSSAEF